MRHPDLEIHDPRADELFNFAIEVLHALGVAIAHRIEKRLAFGFSLFNVISRTHRRFEDFHSSDTPFAVFARKETLGNNVAKGFTKAGAGGLVGGHVGNAKASLDR